MQGGHADHDEEVDRNGLILWTALSDWTEPIVPIQRAPPAPTSKRKAARSSTPRLAGPAAPRLDARQLTPHATPAQQPVAPPVAPQAVVPPDPPAGSLAAFLRDVHAHLEGHAATMIANGVPDDAAVVANMTLDELLEFVAELAPMSAYHIFRLKKGLAGAQERYAQSRQNAS